MSGSGTVAIPLTLGKVAIIDDADYAAISRFKWHAEKTPRGSYYAATTLGRRTVRMHQLIIPGVSEVDHRDGDGLNNRRNNLRAASRMQNTHNTRKQRKQNLTSKFKGVTLQPRLKRRPWQARIGARHLGYFPSEQEAAAAYDAAAKGERGEFALTNGINVPLSHNHRYAVVRREFKPTPTSKHPNAQVLEYELACGHVHQISGFKAPKIGLESRCKTCAGVA